MSPARGGRSRGLALGNGEYAIGRHADVFRHVRGPFRDLPLSGVDRPLTLSDRNGREVREAE